MLRPENEPAYWVMRDQGQESFCLFHRKQSRGVRQVLVGGLRTCASALRFLNPRFPRIHLDMSGWEPNTNKTTTTTH